MKAVRDHADVRPVDMARAVGVSGATVSDWEAGNVVPRDEYLAKLAAFLGVTREFLRYGVGEAPLAHFHLPDEVSQAVAEAVTARRGEAVARSDTPSAEAPRRRRSAGDRGGSPRPKDRR